MVPDLHMSGIYNLYPAGMYVPVAQNPASHLGLAAHTAGRPLALSEAVRDRVRALDRSLPVYAVDSMDGVLGRETFFFRLIGTIFSILGAAALALAAVGLYGVLAFSVSRRLTEVGIRLALGAAARDVLALVLGQGLKQIGIGLALGLAMAAGVANLLSSQLFGVRALDPPTFALAAVLLAAAGAAASFVPALRALGVDPVDVLRYE